MRRRRSRLMRLARVWFWRLQRIVPDWLDWLTPVGVSLAVHGVLLFLLALFVLLTASSRSNNGGVEIDTVLGQLGDDLTSLNPADRAGDPFTKEQTLDPPSLPVPGAERSVDFNTPDFGDALRIGSEINLEGGRNVGGVPRTEEGAIALTRPGELVAPFQGRQTAARARLVRREGGSVESEKAVARALDWLARHQKADGSWSLDHKPQCAKGKGCPASPHLDGDAAATGLGLLPFLGAGQSHTEKGKFQDNVQRGIDWLRKLQHKDGEIFIGGGNTRMYSHAIATMALCEAFGITRDESLRGPAQRAIDFIVRAQNQDDGGWRYNPLEPGDTSVFGWQVFALRSAQLAGLEVNKQAIKGAAKYLDRAATDDAKSTYAYQPGGPPTPVMTAEGLLARQILGWPRDSAGMKTGVEFVASDLHKHNNRNIYYWYYATQLLHNVQGRLWRDWNVKIREGLVSRQTGGTGCDHGSWDPVRPVPDQWGVSAGRHFTTALSTLTLEVYYRYLPLYGDSSARAAK